MSTRSEVQSPVRFVQTLWATHPPLLLSAVLAAGLSAFFLAGIFLDPRYVMGAPVWLKPLKFAVSISMYNLTLLWMLGFVQGRARLVSVLAWTVLITLALELLVIATQAFRGTTSHFNVSTPLDGALWASMGVSIVGLWLAHLWTAILVLRQPFTSPVLAWSLRLGLMLTLVGMSEGALMTLPTAQQLADFQGVAGAHGVGAPDDSAGLMLVGWSTVGGDLRIGHFVGLHALQVLPLIGALLLRLPRLTDAQRLHLLWTGAGLYLGLMALVTWQALRAQPLLAPDALTFGGLSLLLITCMLRALFIVVPRLG
ncbi:hypothetical protein [Deinococcus peraridilitoris]|uniref:Uncharacterized protein n=1 Tax=Deinococcus peraridilitoris (strain DSM 19664 / LMG 22246 / CIP 109416 / KR-200) TaxID=937777 RepID=K9ZXY2_DEIPD|nr:hypothetical protein [Deinococcus peraridilitoris]AFZ66461.1 hypothetical protein Deipe_0891 [Deinococcus peraridilitoris DSM 19664]